MHNVLEAPSSRPFRILRGIRLNVKKTRLQKVFVQRVCVGRKSQQSRGLRVKVRQSKKTAVLQGRA